MGWEDRKDPVLGSVKETQDRRFPQVTFRMQSVPNKGIILTVLYNGQANPFGFPELAFENYDKLMIKLNSIVRRLNKKAGKRESTGMSMRDGNKGDMAVLQAGKEIAKNELRAANRGSASSREGITQSQLDRALKV